MSQQAMATVMDRFTNDPAFREELRHDPLAAISRGGFELTAQEREEIASTDWNIQDEPLKERVSKLRR